MESMRLIELKEASSLCGVTPRLFNRWIEEEGMPLHRRRGGSAVHWKDLRKCLRRRGLPIPDTLSRGPKVLLIDGDPDSLLLLVETFENLWDRSRIGTAPSGRSGLKKALEQRPDLIVTDLFLPDLSGLELCRLIRESRELPRTKVLAVAAPGALSRRWDALSCGADEYLVKPFSPGELRGCAFRLLGKNPGVRRDSAGRIPL